MHWNEVRQAKKKKNLLATPPSRSSFSAHENPVFAVTIFSLQRGKQELRLLQLIYCLSNKLALEASFSQETLCSKTRLRYSINAVIEESQWSQWPKPTKIWSEYSGPGTISQRVPVSRDGVQATVCLQLLPLQICTENDQELQCLLGGSELLHYELHEVREKRNEHICIISFTPLPVCPSPGQVLTGQFSSDTRQIFTVSIAEGHSITSPQ